MGLHVANLARRFTRNLWSLAAADDPEATTTAFRERYLSIVRSTAREYLCLTTGCH